MEYDHSEQDAAEKIKRRLAGRRPAARSSTSRTRTARKVPFFRRPLVRLVLFLLLAAALWYFQRPASSPSVTTGDAAADSAADSAVAGETAEIHFIDVGQGDSVLIKQGTHFALIDTGTPASRDALCAYLDAQGVRTLDYLVLTHYHSDHIGGAVRVLQQYSVKNVLLPNAELGPTSTTPTTEKLLETVQKQVKAGTLKAGTPAVGDEYSLGSGTLTVVGAGIDSEDLNSTSLITLFRFGSFTYFSSGDADRAAEDELLNRMPDGLHADLYKAAHHGSSTANSAELLTAVRPGVIVISCGLNNDYGHPHAEALARMQDTGAAIWRTDQNGSVVVTVRDGRMTVRAQKEAD